MIKIEVVEFQGRTVCAKSFPSGGTFAELAMLEWPEGFPGSTPLIYGPDGDLVSDHDAVNRSTMDGEVWRIVLRPQAFLATPILGVALGWWIVTAVSLAATFLMVPSIPSASS